MMFISETSIDILNKKLMKFKSQVNRLYKASLHLVLLDSDCICVRNQEKCEREFADSH